jgi:hypothetical protein
MQFAVRSQHIVCVSFVADYRLHHSHAVSLPARRLTGRERLVRTHAVEYCN